MRDREAMSALYMGNSTLYRWDHIRPWLRPLGWWTLFTMLLIWSMLCLTAIFRRQWDAERLTYPIAEIPLQVITQTDTLLRSRLLWGGVAIGAAGQIINLIHVLVPSVPGVPIGVQYFQAETPPWNAAGPLPISSFPFAYGLTFLLPTQLGFSVWFFMLFSRLELVASAMWGYKDVNPWSQFPFLQQQSVGAILGLFLTVIWAARDHLRAVWRAAIHPASAALEDADEPMSYRIARFRLPCGNARDDLVRSRGGNAPPDGAAVSGDSVCHRGRGGTDARGVGVTDLSNSTRSAPTRRCSGSEGPAPGRTAT